MFVLRPEHMEAFTQSCRETFEDQMATEVAIRFPGEYEELGEERVRQRIRDGMDRAVQHEIVAVADIARFIRFTFSLGPDFDTARRTHWARAILVDTTTPPGERLDRIREEARRRRTEDRA